MPRLRTVFRNDMVAHVWANQSQEEGRSHNGNISFRGPVLYSYATPIAVMCATAAGPVALVSRETYSPTTSQHIPSARDIPGGRMFRVPFLPVPPHGFGSLGRYRPPAGLSAWASPEESAAAVHAANLESMRAEAEAVAGKYVKRPRRPEDSEGPKSFACYSWPAFQGDGSAGIHAAARAYASAFGLPVPVWAEEAAETEFRRATESARAERLARLDSPAARARREREAARRLAALSPIDRAAYEARRKAGGRGWQAAQAAREARRAAILAEFPTAESVRDAWRAGAHIPAEARDVWYSWQTTETGHDVFRAKGESLETARGAVVPLAHARAAFRFVALRRAAGRPWTRADGTGPRVGHFTVDSVSAAGDMVAGCHRFAWADMARLAAALGEPETVSEAGGEAA